ncbi:MAG: ACP S-malonyltransferase [Dehalococcoidales bacterium]|nr:ACP S-malonyltransferase [Dehalococcoidales bacterium]
MTDSCIMAFVFPGQGSQFAGMGRDLYAEFEPAREVFKETDAALGFPLSHLCFEGPEEELTQTVNVQPAIVTMSLAILAVIRQYKNTVMPLFVAGHSLGEYTALSAADILGIPETVILARKRGELMHRAGLKKPGAMTAILGLSDIVVSEICSQAGVYIANYNCPGQLVISGESHKINHAMELASSRGAIKVVALRVTGAFHTVEMQPAADELETVLQGISFNKPSVPLIANTDGVSLVTADQVKTELVKQMCHAIQWQKSIEYMLCNSVDTFVEIGPGRVLSGLIKRIAREARVINIADVSGLKDFLNKE